MTSRSTSLRFLRAVMRSALWATRSMSRREPEAASCRMAMASEVKSSFVAPAAVNRARMYSAVSSEESGSIETDNYSYVRVRRTTAA